MIAETIKSDVSSGAGDGVYRPTYYHGEQLSSIERARSNSLKDPKMTQVIEKGKQPEESEESGNHSLLE